MTEEEEIHLKNAVLNDKLVATSLNQALQIRREEIHKDYVETATALGRPAELLNILDVKEEVAALREALRKQFDNLDKENAYLKGEIEEFKQMFREYRDKMNWTVTQLEGQMDRLSLKMNWYKDEILAASKTHSSETTSIEAPQGPFDMWVK